MNEANAKLLQTVIIFWLLVGLFAQVFSSRIGTYFLQGADTSDFTDTTGMTSSNFLNIIWNVMSFQVTETVPLWVSVLLNIIAVLTIIAVIFAVVDR